MSILYKSRERQFTLSAGYSVSNLQTKSKRSMRRLQKSALLWVMWWKRKGKSQRNPQEWKRSFFLTRLVVYAETRRRFCWRRQKICIVYSKAIRAHSENVLSYGYSATQQCNTHAAEFYKQIIARSKPKLFVRLILHLCKAFKMKMSIIDQASSVC